MTSDDLISWLRWADAADSDLEKNMRATRVWQYVFPFDLDSKEKKRRESIVKRVKAMEAPEDDDWEGWPEPKPLPEFPTPLHGKEEIKEDVQPELNIVERIPYQWEGLIPLSSSAYKRGSLHDGTYEEVRQMREKGKGNPFDV